MDQRLFEASIFGDVKKLDELLKKDPQILQKVFMSPSAENTPLHVASLAGHVDFVKQVLEKMPSFAEDRNKDGFMSIHLATAAGHLEVVKELLRKAGPGQCLLTDNEGRRAIHYAAIKGRVKIVRELLSTCPEAIEQLTVHCENALLLAVKNSQSEAFQVLFEASRDHLDNKHEERMNTTDHQGNEIILEVARDRNQHQVIGIIESTAQLNHQQITSGNVSCWFILRRFFSEGWSEVYDGKLMPVVCALIAQTTYQAAVNHPPSIWREGISLDTKCIPDNWMWGPLKRPTSYYICSCPAFAYCYFMVSVVLAFSSAMILIPLNRGNFYTFILMSICFGSMMVSVIVSVRTTTPSTGFFNFVFDFAIICTMLFLGVILIQRKPSSSVHFQNANSRRRSAPALSV